MKKYSKEKRKAVFDECIHHCEWVSTNDGHIIIRCNIYMNISICCKKKFIDFPRLSGTHYILKKKCL